MSTSTSPSTDGHVSPDQAFDRIVWYNPRVCNGCFEHVKDIDEASLTRNRSEPLDVQDHHRTEHATLEQDDRIVEAVAIDVEGTEVPGEKRTAVPRTTCASCSRIGCWADDETLSKVQALRLTTPLIARLEEADLKFDRYTLREFVRIAKGLDKYAGYDTEIFRCAVKTAMRRA